MYVYASLHMSKSPGTAFFVLFCFEIKSLFVTLATLEVIM